MTRKRRRIRAAVEAAAEDGTSAELLATLARTGVLSDWLKLFGERKVRMDWGLSAARGKVAES